MNPKS
ncbi:hypothetical protein AT5G23115 [Arabidopsis thaliana]|eukprot:NP_001336532.1 hypothetical protein AT5G23115 [Arabidopsis thaliana]